MFDAAGEPRPGFWDRVATALQELNPLTRPLTSPLTRPLTRRELAAPGAPSLPARAWKGAEAVIAADWTRCAERQVSISVMLIEIDFFSDLRREQGGVVATRRLLRVAELVRSHLPSTSRIVQLTGSSRLVATLPDGPILLARLAAEKIRRAALVTIPEVSRKAGDSLSIGVAAANPAEAGHRELLDGGVLALGRAVARGRNRVDSIDLRSELMRMAKAG